MSWPEQPVERFCTKVFSGGTPSTKRNDFYGGTIPWLRTQEVSFEPIWDTEVKITEAGLNGSSVKWVPADSVIVAMYGASAGRVAINRIPLTTNQACCNLQVDCTKADYRYVYYALRQRFEALESLAKGAAQRNLNAGQVRSFCIPAPPLYEQTRIASILSTYDDLIENNRRRIQLLEQAARLLYKEWFVHLRFPGHEHTKIINGIPEGWENSTVRDSASFLGRGITPKYDDNAPGLVINQKCIRNRMVSLELARRQSKQVPPTKLVQFGDVLINSTGTGTLGRVAQFLLNTNECTVDSHITIVRPKEDVPVYYFGLHLTGLEPYIATLGRGATNQTELSKDDIAALEMILPSSGPAQMFESIVDPSFRQIRILSEQVEKLIKARDLLLPKLMNGEMAV